MKITAIQQQVKRAGRYSVFVEGKYAFSLSDTALLQTKLVPGQELTPDEVEEYKQLSNDDKLYNRTLAYIAMRPRSEWEIRTYLEKKGASPALIDSILNKLSIVGLVDDEKFARAFVADRRLLRPTSARKLSLELKKKHVAEDVIRQAIGDDQEDEQAALQHIIERKRLQTRYQDDLKLMQYLARQGFNYGDIKVALQKDD